MYVGRRYPLTQTLHWSRMDWFPGAVVGSFKKKDF
jgi:hypothetical protein